MKQEQNKAKMGETKERGRREEQHEQTEQEPDK